MPQFVCDNKNTQDLLSKLYTLVKARGAYINDDVGFVCRNGYFSVQNAGGLKPNQNIINLPETCAVRGEEFTLGFHDNQITMLSHSHLVQPHEIEIMCIVLEIYNVNNKLAHHRHSSILTLFYEDPNLFKILVGYCKWNVFRGLEQKNELEYIGANFMKFRMMGKGREGKFPAGTPVLLPFIEYFNHHPVAGIVEEYAGANKSGFEVLASSPYENNDLYVRYGFFDCFDLFVLQGYIESNTFFVRSRPLTIDIENLCRLDIDIQLRSSDRNALPEDMQDLGPYVPHVTVDKVKKEVYMGHAIIPSSHAPKALRRVLKFVFDQIAETQEQAMQAVAFAEKEIVEHNITYYKALSEYLNAYKPSPVTAGIIKNAQQMAQMQMRKIQYYATLSGLNIAAQIAVS